tara:strand:+ start:375 stop:641 length:267 start_codon:yes stop_codon:yes gene_type:complete
MKKVATMFLMLISVSSFGAGSAKQFHAPCRLETLPQGLLQTVTNQMKDFLKEGYILTSIIDVDKNKTAVNITNEDNNFGPGTCLYTFD